MKSIYSIFLCLLLISASNILAQNDDSEFRKYVDDMNDKFTKALVAGDYQTIASMYADDAISLQNYEPMWVGKDKILEGNKKDLTESGMKITNASGKTMQIIGSGDLRVEIGTFEMTVTPPNSTTAMVDHGKYMNVWQKQSDGTWKLKADTWNSDSNPMSNMAGAKSKDDSNK